MVRVVQREWEALSVVAARGCQQFSKRKKRKKKNPAHTLIQVYHHYSYFVSYETVKRYLTPADSTTLSLPAVIMAGGCAGVAMWSIAIPPDTIKSRLQSAPNGTYTGFMDCARKLIAKDGVPALWKGFGPAVSFVV
jgi:hypothetical protein